jgi:glycosyltransferase involved in cell wall biosynthesis
MSRSSSDPSLVSVVIPVFNDRDRLADCLTALHRQTWPAERLEIIVVDNGSADDPAKLADRFPRVRWERETRPGSYSARNRGIRVSTGDILAFTDSDCMPRPRWICEGVRGFSRTSKTGLVGGGIDMVFTDPTRLTPAELFEKKNAFRHERQLQEHHFAVTANMFTRRDVLDAVGVFNDRLKSGGDKEWGNRVYRAGYDLAYAPEARVGHPARRTFRELGRKTVRVVGGLRDSGWESPRTPGMAARDVLHSLRVLAGLVGRFLLRRPPTSFFPTTGEQLRYFAAMAFVEAVRNLERFRLDLGGRSRR